MYDLVAKFVTFTEPLVIGGFGLVVLGIVFAFWPDERKYKLKIEVQNLLPRSTAGLALTAFVVISSIGTMTESFTYWVADFVHDRVVEHSESNISVKPEAVCNAGMANLPDLTYVKGIVNARDLEGILAGLPREQDGKGLPEKLTERATYSLRLLRGMWLWLVVGFVGCVWGYAALWPLPRDRHRNANSSGIRRAAVGFLIAWITTNLAWYGSELEFHRSARYIALKYLVAGDKAPVVCRLIGARTLLPRKGQLEIIGH